MSFFFLAIVLSVLQYFLFWLPHWYLQTFLCILNLGLKVVTPHDIVCKIPSKIISIIIPHILITINRFDWTMGKNQNTWSHRTKIIFHHFGSLAGFPARVIGLWQENVRGTWNASFEGDHYNVVFKYLRQRSNGLKKCLPAVFYIPVYMFSWFHSV